MKRPWKPIHQFSSPLSKFKPHCRILHLAGLCLALIVAGSSLRSRSEAEARGFDDRAATEVTISTIAGGGFGSNVPARQAPMVQPTVVTFDPQGRGVYVVDEVNGTSLLRFVNTSTAPVALAGATILSKQINLIAGGGAQTNDGVIPRDTDLAQITGLAVAPSGNLLFVAIPAFSSIRAINVGTQDLTAFGKNIAAGTVNTIAAPNFVDFRGLTLHPSTGELYFIAGRVVYKLENNGNLTVVAGGGNPGTGNGDGGQATLARLVTPMALVFDANNNLLIADGGDARNVAGSIRRVNSSNIITSLTTGLEFPTGITLGPNGDAYVALGNAQEILRVTPAGVKTVVAGNSNMLTCDINANPTCGDGGAATQASLNIPDSTSNTTLIMAVDARGLYLPDYRYKRVRFVNLSSAPVNLLDVNINPQTINTIIGSGLSSPYDGTPAASADLFVPTGIALDGAGNLFISDTGNNRLRFVNRTSTPVTLFVTTPYATTVQPGQIVTLNRNAGELQTDDRITTAFFLAPQGLATTSNGVLIADSQAGALIKIPPTSVAGRRSGVIRFLNTSNADVTFFPNSADAKVTIPPGQIKDIAGVRPPNNPQTLGDGLPANKIALYPTDVAIDRAGNLFIADQVNNRIRRIDAATGIVSTAYGDGTTTTLNGATGIAFDVAGRLHIADTRNNRVLRQDAVGGSTYSVIADAAKQINRPRDLTVDNTGKVFIANAVTNQVLDLEAPTNTLGVTSVVAGNGSAGFSGDDGDGPRARLNLPNPGAAINDIQVTTNIISLPNGDLMFADTNNNRIRMLRRKTAVPTVASVSAASFLGGDLAAESITAAFGEKLATSTQIAAATPLPTSLAGTTVKIIDSRGAERLAPLFFVAPTQINYQIPPNTATGAATIIVTGGDGAVSTGALNIANVAPGMFTANSSGQGVAAAVLLRVKENGAQIFEPIAQFDQAQNKFVPIPIDLGPATDQLFLILYGTGMRFHGSLSSVTATLGGAPAEVLYAGPAEGFVGLDQSNVRLPRALAGRNVVDVILTVDGKPANTIMAAVK